MQQKIDLLPTRGNREIASQRVNGAGSPEVKHYHLLHSILATKVISHLIGQKSQCTHYSKGVAMHGQYVRLYLSMRSWKQAKWHQRLMESPSLAIEGERETEKR
ncbi:hypothetical protein AVEN_115016-1 [Araneus ventricosus]|uniref:Uncharacterized protein n=1 Tax=Araneus ventricosus TaxID=182803 RepID=A0A4Y1ZWX6_ARAVE|nr:hypothetical protein AVEN_115016-1 [Araneus ventricosus]